MPDFRADSTGKNGRSSQVIFWGAILDFGQVALPSGAAAEDWPRMGSAAVPMHRWEPAHCYVVLSFASSSKRSKTLAGWSDFGPYVTALPRESARLAGNARAAETRRGSFPPAVTMPPGQTETLSASRPHARHSKCS